MWWEESLSLTVHLNGHIQDTKLCFIKLYRCDIMHNQRKQSAKKKFKLHALMLWLTIWKECFILSRDIKLYNVSTTSTVNFILWYLMYSKCLKQFLAHIGVKIYVKWINDQDDIDAKRASFLANPYIPWFMIIPVLSYEHICLDLLFF